MPKTIAQLEAELNQLRTKLKNEKRKADTRRKILIGSCVISAIEQDFLHDEWVTNLLDKFVSRPSDRAFLGLQSLNDNDNGHQATVDEIVDDLVAETPSDSSEYSYQ